MKTTQILAAVAILAAGSTAFAAQGPSLTREQVKAELADVLKTHHYDPISAQYVKNEVERVTSRVSREQVLAELAEVQKTKAYDVIHGHYELTDPVKSTRSRAEVQAELAAVQKTHHYDPISGQYVPNASL